MEEIFSAKTIKKDIKKIIKWQDKAFETAFCAQACRAVTDEVNCYYSSRKFSGLVLMKRLKWLMATKDGDKNVVIPAILGIVTGILSTAFVMHFEQIAKTINNVIKSAMELDLWQIEILIIGIIFMGLSVYIVMLLPASYMLSRVYRLSFSYYNERGLIFYPFEINLIKEKLRVEYGVDIDSNNHPKSTDSSKDLGTFLTIENGNNRLKYKLVEVEQLADEDNRL